MSGRAQASVSKRRHQEVFWHRRHGKSAREIARAMRISLGTVSYYIKLGIPDYDPYYDTDRLIPDDLLTESERREPYDYRGLRSLRSRTVVVRPSRPKGHLSMLPGGGGRERDRAHRRPGVGAEVASGAARAVIYDRPTSAAHRCAIGRPGRPDRSPRRSASCTGPCGCAQAV
jgi:hypothetical protein